MTKIDIYLSEHILHMQNLLDSRFRVDGVQEFRKHHQNCGCVFEYFIADYVLSRWYIFTHQN